VQRVDRTEGQHIGPQGPGAISIDIRSAPIDTTLHLLATVRGLQVFYFCGDVGFMLVPESSADSVFASGGMATNGTLTSVQKSAPSILAGDTSTPNLDVIAWAGSVGILSRFDLGGYDSGAACNIWGLITPGSAS